MPTTTRSATIASGGPPFGMGDPFWTNVSGLITSDDDYAAIEANPFQNAPPTLFASGFGFSIPAENGIDGFQVNIEGYTDGFVSGDSAALYFGESVSSDGKSIADPLPASEGTISVGSPSDDWNYTLTKSQVNNSSFGVGVNFQVPFDLSAPVSTGFIDHIELAITHSPTGVSSSFLRPQTIVGNSNVFKLAWLRS